MLCIDEGDNESEDVSVLYEAGKNKVMTDADQHDSSRQLRQLLQNLLE